MGYTDLVTHSIDTPEAIPQKSRPYRVSHTERQVIQDQVDEMLQHGVIEQSQSPWSSPVILVKKKEGDMRFCVDYRKLNAVTTKSNYPLPLIDNIFLCLKDSKYYSSLDLFSGFWQIGVHPNSVEKTAFITPDGLYHFLKMPFGLCNAPSTFQNLADKVFQGLKWKECLSYIDDVLVFSATFEEHLVRLRNVFNRL